MMKIALASSLMALLAASPALAADVNAVASFSILGDMVARVGGDRVAVTTIVGPNADGHVYEAKPSDAAAVSAADVFFVNGLGFEGWMERLFEATGYAGAVVTVSDGVATHEMAEEDEHDHAEGDSDHEEHDDHDGHHHEGTDPHAWQNLQNAVIYVNNIAAGLCKVDASGCTAYEANAASYVAELAALDTEVKAEIAAISADRRKVITSHDAFGYFAEAYGVTFVAPLGVSTESEPSAAQVAELITQIRNEHVTALFIENMTDPRLLEQIADETGVKVGGELYADALSEADGPAATYLDMFKYNVAQLIPAMKGE